MATKLKEMPSVNDVETAKAVFVARSLTLCRTQGYGLDCESALHAAGLSDYFAGQNDNFTVSLARLVTMLGESLTLQLAKGRNPSNRASEVRDSLWPVIGEWAKDLTADEWELKEPSTKIVDIDETCKTYGKRGPVPPTTSDEVTETWRQLTLAVLRWADAKGLCSTVEDYLRAIGMEAFIPPRHVNLTVEWNGHTFDLTQVPANRLGEPNPRDLHYYVHQQITSDGVTVKPESIVPANV